MMTKEAVIKAVEDNNIEFIRLEYMDYSGVIRGRTISPAQLKSAMKGGISFSTPNISLDCFDEVVEDSMYGPNDGDFFAIPDPNTFAILPYREKTARMICDLVDQFGEPWAGCPRGALKRMLHKVETLFDGMMYMAFEQESYLLKEVDGKLVPADQTHCLSIEGMDIHEAFLRDFVRALNAMGIETEQFSSEYGPGQLEINLKYASALQAADDQFTFAQLFKQLARDRGLVGTLMPKPYQDKPGSGLHVHMSMYDKAGRNLFEDLNDPKDLNLSDKAYHYIGGLLHHASSLTAIGAPSINSYTAFKPKSIREKLRTAMWPGFRTQN